MLGGLKVAQLVSLLFIIAGFTIYIYSLKTSTKKKKTNQR